MNAHTNHPALLTPGPIFDRIMAIEVMGWDSAWFDRQFEQGHGFNHWRQDQVPNREACRAFAVEYFGNEPPKGGWHTEITSWRPSSNLDQAMRAVLSPRFEDSKGNRMAYFRMRETALGWTVEAHMAGYDNQCLAKAEECGVELCLAACRAALSLVRLAPTWKPHVK